MKCSNCGSEFQGNFCPICGTRAHSAELCPVCGRQRADGERFCAHCGHDFLAAQTPPSGESVATPVTPSAPTDAGARTEAPAGANEQQAQTAPSAQQMPPAQPMQPSAQPAQLPMQPGMQPMQPMPMQPGMQPMQPNARSMPQYKLGKYGKPLPPDILLPFDCRLWAACTVPIFTISIMLFSAMGSHAAAYTVGDLSLIFILTLLIDAAAIFIIMYVMRDIFAIYKPSLYANYKKVNKTIDPKLYLGGGIGISVFASAGCFGLTIFFSTTYPEGVHPLAIVYCLLLSVVPLLLGVAHVILWNVRKKRITAAYYGKENPQKGDKPIVTYGHIAQALADYRMALEEYWLAPARAKCAARGAALSGIELTFNVKKHTTLTYIVAWLLLVAVGIYAIFNVLSFTNNIFRADKVQRIELGMMQSEVRRMFGYPYEGSTDDLKSSETVWKYYDSDYMKLLKKNDSFDMGDIEDTDDFENAFKDSAKLESQEFAYIEITFDKDGNDAGIIDGQPVIGVMFNAERTRKKQGTKSAKDREIISVEVTLGSVAPAVVYEASYSDGSYYKGRTSGAWIANGESADEVGKTVTVECIGAFGDEFSVTATVTEAETADGETEYPEEYALAFA